MDALRGLSENTRALWAGATVDEAEFDAINALWFCREHVSASRPLLIRGCTPTALCSLDDVAAAAGNVDVSVNVTPNGLADSIVRDTGVFAEPEQRIMPFDDFVRILRSESEDVFYLSQQNDNLRTQLPELAAVVSPEFDFATAAFGAPPDAVNLWVGDGRSISALHCDPYENMYAVLCGTKVFTLLPPSDAAFLPESNCRAARWRQRGAARDAARDATRSGDARGACSCDRDRDRDRNRNRDHAGGVSAEAAARGWELSFQDSRDKTSASRTASRVAWVDVDPLLESSVGVVPGSAVDTADNCDLLALATPITVRVHAGETLYIPSFWFHRVAQVGETVAVNYWHDAAYSTARFVLFEYVKAQRAGVVARANSRKSAATAADAPDAAF